MVDSSDLIGLYIAIPLYFCFLLGAAVWGMLRIRRQKAAMAEEGVKEDNLTVHYLGGRSFNGFLTAGTMFASFFSGYSEYLAFIDTICCKMLCFGLGVYVSMPRCNSDCVYLTQYLSITSTMSHSYVKTSLLHHHTSRRRSSE